MRISCIHLPVHSTLLTVFQCRTEGISRAWVLSKCFGDWGCRVDSTVAHSLWLVLRLERDCWKLSPRVSPWFRLHWSSVTLMHRKPICGTKSKQTWSGGKEGKQWPSHCNFCLKFQGQVSLLTQFLALAYLWKGMTCYFKKLLSL